VEEKNNKSNKKENKTLIIIVIVIGLALVIGGVFLGTKLQNKDEPKNEEPPIDNSKPDDLEPGKKKELNDSNAISKLEKFVIVASYEDSNENGKANMFMNGISSLDHTIKLRLAWNSLINIQKIQTKVGTDVAEKYKNVAGIEEKEEISLVQFDTEYKSLFNENTSYTENDNFSGCPGIYKIDKELGKIIIGVECGGFNPTEYYSKIYKYEEDNSFYYVYEYVGTNDSQSNKLVKVSSREEVDVPSFEGNEDKFETVVWKFDKNFNFISTENIG
jgi:hypothetical protein